VHFLGAGESLRNVAERYYGNFHYSLVIELVNDIADPNLVEPGTRIRVPKLDAILAEEGVSTVMSLEMHAMLQARAAYMEVEDELRSVSRDAPGGYASVPEDVRLVLRDAAHDMWGVAMALRVLKPEVRIIPNRAIGQLKAISFHLNRISYGALDSFGYDLDVIHQRLAWAICNSIIWARNDYQYR